ncbi:hypothetical protein GCM10023257_23430 [Streptomyces hyderabadensis]|uniref:Uncharacterized protein n=1 Tax=Streptomyces hyderabadensis TaxID=598549 RepID=A0ABP9I049_9ACTN
MEGDDGLETAGTVLAEHDLLMTPLVRVEQGVQYISRCAVYVGHGGDSCVGAAMGGSPP